MGVPQQQQGLVLTVTSVTGDMISYTYNGLSGNQPITYANALYLWQDPTDAVPRNINPPFNNPPQSDDTDGSGVFTARVEGKPYLLTYAVAQSVAACAASVWIPASGTNWQSFEPSVTISDLESNTVTFSFSLPPGMTPQADGDWVGVWQGQEGGILYSLPPKWSTPISNNNYNGDGYVVCEFERDTTYTLGYFKTGWSKTKLSQTTLACTTTFQSP